MQIMKIILTIIAAIFAAATQLFAQSDLLITPYRVVFEGGKNMEEISLANTGKDTSRYSINFVQYRMNEDGSMEQIAVAETGQYFSDSYLRIFPRSVVLAPNESQIVRVQVKTTGDMQNAEYRSHLYFRSVPNLNAVGNETEIDSSLGINLIPIYGITIPVIIRIGELQATATFSDIVLDKSDNPKITLTINRDGEKSIYGDINVMYIPASGEPIKIGAARGVAVYTPNALRIFSIPLSKPEGVDFNNGKISITYTSAGTPKAEKYCDYTINL
jgi:hypothetical protein